MEAVVQQLEEVEASVDVDESTKISDIGLMAREELWRLIETDEKETTVTPNPVSEVEMEAVVQQLEEVEASVDVDESTKISDIGLMAREELWRSIHTEEKQKTVQFSDSDSVNEGGIESTNEIIDDDKVSNYCLPGKDLNES